MVIVHGLQKDLSDAQQSASQAAEQWLFESSTMGFCFVVLKIHAYKFER
jgi:hypothetical protein